MSTRVHSGRLANQGEDSAFTIRAKGTHLHCHHMELVTPLPFPKSISWVSRSRFFYSVVNSLRTGTSSIHWDPLQQSDEHMGHA